MQRLLTMPSFLFASSYPKLKLLVEIHTDILQFSLQWNNILVKNLQPNHLLRLETQTVSGTSFIISTIIPLCICIEFLTFQRVSHLLSHLTITMTLCRKKGQVLLSAIDRWGNYCTERLSVLPKAREAEGHVVSWLPVQCSLHQTTRKGSAHRLQAQKK